MALNLERLIHYFGADLGLGEVTPDTELFSSGLLDSFTLVDVIVFIETEAGFKIPAPDVNFDNLDTPERIIAYALSKGADVGGEVARSEESNPIVDAYSEVADAYDGQANADSFWEGISSAATKAIDLRKGYAVIADVPCGTGRALAELAARAGPAVQLLGVEPAQRMRELAVARTAEFPSVSIHEGAFEQLPLESQSVDFLCSHWGFHWAVDPERAASELARVLSERGELDLFFTGRHSGREFTPLLSPIYARYLGLNGLLDSVKRRLALEADGTRELFAKHFDPARLSVQDVYRTFHDTLDGHLGWWVRIEGHFLGLADEDREACDLEVREALAGLQTDQGIPYTMHMVHVSVAG